MSEVFQEQDDEEDIEQKVDDGILGHLGPSGSGLIGRLLVRPLKTPFSLLAPRLCFPCHPNRLEHCGMAWGMVCMPNRTSWILACHSSPKGGFPTLWFVYLI